MIRLSTGTCSSTGRVTLYKNKFCYAYLQQPKIPGGNAEEIIEHNQCKEEIDPVRRAREANKRTRGEFFNYNFEAK